MKTILETLKRALGVALFVAVFASLANAQCASLSLAGRSSSLLRRHLFSRLFSPAALKPAAFTNASPSSGINGDPIVGFWYFQFIAEGNTVESSGLPPNLVPPDDTVIDSGYWQWHSDGTEIMNSTRPPATQSYCLGIWQNVGPSRYKVNHFPISWNSDGTYLGPANIRDDITLSHDRSTFSGTFTFNQYNSAGNRLVHITGNIVGKRITMDTPVTDVLPVPPPPAP